MAEQHDEIDRLKYRIAKLEEEKDILKNFSLFREKSKAITVTDIYQFIERQKQRAKAKWAEILGVSTSGYYIYLKNRKHRESQKEKVSEKVKE